ncbi:Autophagy-related protein [Quillaja saponaria]|uniref:Autophagy-related protein n=1 Tax=Quillaja saponaria TaxID=32244 RepID=A0AAD7KT30_QUISA|nr:Autophagy-related protein [Quillaja saponaria]
MASSHSETAKMEQIITEFFAKSLHIILESRAPYVSSRNFSGEQTVSSPSSSSSSSSSVRPRDKWFNLALRECPAALENIDLCRQSNLEPVVVDVILVQRPVDWDPLNFSPKMNPPRNVSLKERYPFCYNTEQEKFGFEAKNENIIERWVVQYESRKVSSSGSRRSNKSSNSTLHTLYKKSTLLLRSLYATVRLLPAYKIFRDLNLSGQILSFTLTHRVSPFVEPFTRKEEAEMHRFGFTPVDTSCGRLCLSVLYRSSVSDVNSKPSTPMSPQVIPDYVGSPLADPLRRFPSVPVTGSPSHGSPSSLPFSRRHSWSYDQYRASSSSINSLPSPTYSDLHASVSNPSSRRFPPTSLPPHPSETYLVQKKNTNYDEYYPSPNLSPSPSPSPPIYAPGIHLSQTLLRSESAPVSIPNAHIANSHGFSNRHNLPPSPPLRGSGCTPKTERGTGVMQTGIMVEKLLSLGKDEYRKYYGLKMSSNSSPQISISRSSSRSYHDDYDDPDFICPFSVDDDDMADPGSRAESFDQGRMSEPLEHGALFPIRKSQDAAVGALVRMLKKAPPLCQDFSGSIDLSQGSRPETLSSNNQEAMKISEARAPVGVMSSGLGMTKKTTTDALEEFQGYREMKNLLLTRGSKSHT